MRALRSKEVGNEAGARGATSAVRTDTLEAFRLLGEGIGEDHSQYVRCLRHQR